MPAWGILPCFCGCSLGQRTVREKKEHTAHVLKSQLAGVACQWLLCALSGSKVLGEEAGFAQGCFNQRTHQILFVYEWSCFLQVCSKHAHGMFMPVGRAVLQSVVSWSVVWREGLGEALYNVCRRGAANH